jgi:membrane-bound lytic murein transglycosylase D
VSARLTEAEDADLASLNWYTAKRGETLQGIARKLGVSRVDLAEANYMRSTARITPGAQLVVPREATAILAARTERPVPVADSRALATADEVVPAVASVSSDRVRIVYRVKRGDTLASIARLFRTTVASLQSWNRMAGSTVIRAGERLTIFTATPAN